MQSESETESTSSSSKIDSSSHSLNGEQVLGEDAEKSSNKDVIPSDVMEKIRNFPDVIEYIKSLQKYIDKQCRKLGKLKAKVKKKRDISTQTEDFLDRTKTVVEEIREAAELATQQTGLVYEETSGMYYDYNTGYYYNAEYGLYYDGNTGTYMTYNQDTKEYAFHSQVQASAPTADEEKLPNKQVITKRKKKLQDSQAAKREKHDVISNLEEGECSGSDSSSVENGEDNSDENSSDAANAWPPCMRIIIEKTSVPNVKEGSLHVITFEGGSLGREGNHSIIIPDINVSKHHLKFSFDKEKSIFVAVDLGSRNGTMLNGKRMSASKQESEELEVVHGSHIQIGTTILLCHIHVGNQTCGHCEPGLIQPKTNTEEQVIRKSKSSQHRAELRHLRKKFGVNQHEAKPITLGSGYTDRAQARRETVGSQNPYEKTEVASVDESISSQNKGFKMLAKMGWSEGQSLGKTGQGLTTPINVTANQGTAGIGCSAPKVENNLYERKKDVCEKMRKRFDTLVDLVDDDTC